jgi:hypothetical protein
MSEQWIEPPDVVGAVETYVYAELADAEKYDNRTPLDEPGIYSLHLLAAHVYAMGYEAGERAAFLRADRERQRLREGGKR